MSKDYNFHFMWEKFAENGLKKNLSHSTLEKEEGDIKFFIRFMNERYQGILDIREVTKEMIIEYQTYLKDYVSEKFKRKLADATRYDKLLVLRKWFLFMVKKDFILINPMEYIDFETLGYRLPKNILTKEEAMKLLETPNVRDLLGIRDRAMLELLYGSAIRREELVTIKVSNIDLLHSYIMITGKGNKDRVVPITKKSRIYLKKYLNKVRRVFSMKKKDGDILFLTPRGKPITKTRINSLVRKYSKQAKIGKNVTPHLLRHSCASHLIVNGCGVRYVQELLGHSEISTTQIYTHLTPINLQKTYRETHPRCVPGKLDEDED